MIQKVLTFFRRRLSQWKSSMDQEWLLEREGSVQVNGRLFVRRAPNSRIVAHSGVVLHGRMRNNPIIGLERTSLSTLDAGALIEIHEGCGLSSVTIACSKRVTIGKNTYIGADSLIVDTDFHTPLPGGKWSDDRLATAKAVTIGESCFIGARVTILKGVTIGDGAVIAANSMVTRDVPARHLAMGNPAQIRPLNDEWIHPQV